MQSGAGNILSGSAEGGTIEVQSHYPFGKGVLGHHALGITGPLQAVLAVSVTWDVVTIVSLLILRQFHLSKLLIDDDSRLAWN